MLRAGELKAIYIPERTDEAIRDLCRARTDAVADLRLSRHRLKGLLLRHGYRYHGKSAWTDAHMPKRATTTTNDTAKASLFKAVREGKVRVLMGSTPKMGEGTNVQKQVASSSKPPLPNCAPTLRPLAWSPVGSSNRLPQNTAPRRKRWRSSTLRVSRGKTRKVIPRAAGADKRGEVFRFHGGFTKSLES
jgi:hypothetical protein